MIEKLNKLHLGTKLKIGTGMLGAGAGLTYGARTGAAIQTTEDQDAGTSMTTGAVLGATAGGIIGSSLLNLAEKTGAGAWYSVKHTPDILENIGGATIGTVKTIGKPIMKYGGPAAKSTGSMIGSLASSLLKENPKELFGYSLSGKGKALMFGAAVVGSLVGANDAYTESRSGIQTGIVNSTPQMTQLDSFQQDMAETYGAGGDLVFALNKNRRG